MTGLAELAKRLEVGPLPVILQRKQDNVHKWCRGGGVGHKVRWVCVICDDLDRRDAAGQPCREADMDHVLGVDDDDRYLRLPPTCSRHGTLTPLSEFPFGDLCTHLTPFHTIRKPWNFRLRQHFGLLCTSCLSTQRR